MSFVSGNAKKVSTTNRACFWAKYAPYMMLEHILSVAARVSVFLQTNPWSRVREGHFQPLWTTGHLPCPHTNQAAQIYLAGEGLWGRSYSMSASQDEVSEVLLTWLPEKLKGDVREAKWTGFMLRAKGGNKEEIQESRQRQWLHLFSGLHPYELNPPIPKS